MLGSTPLALFTIASGRLPSPRTPPSPSNILSRKRGPGVCCPGTVFYSTNGSRRHPARSRHCVFQHKRIPETSETISVLCFAAQMNPETSWNDPNTAFCSAKGSRKHSFDWERACLMTLGCKAGGPRRLGDSHKKQALRLPAQAAAGGPRIAQLTRKSLVFKIPFTSVGGSISMWYLVFG